MASPELKQEATTQIQLHLAQGFETPEQFLPGIIEMLADEHDEDEVRRVVAELLPKLQSQHVRDQRTWPSVTDCDRLDAAFEALNASGIMAKHHWWCCGNCGAAAMPEEFDRIGGRWQGTPIVGYAFYHVQDTESAVDNGDLCLNFGSCEQASDAQAYEAQSIAVARTVVACLREQGLEVDWDETYGRRPRVRVTWQRRSRPHYCEGD
jgi:hypothetical protein